MCERQQNYMKNFTVISDMNVFVQQQDIAPTCTIRELDERNTS